MTIQDQSGVTRSHGNLTVGNGESFISGSHSASRIQLNDQFSCGNDYAPKVRKPYTITKQRERWTDEEHKKFLEALKLHGRAWRRIEEHVGTKTAVQIRSHAQKFFSKVVRDSGGSNASLVEPIEIPPPRPKRKPMHPYPRKVVDIPNREIFNTEHSVRFNSAKSLDFDQENKSPKSVLSAIISETIGSSDSDTPTGSLSPVSSVSGVHNSSFAIAEQKTPFEEDQSPSPVGLNACSVHYEHPIVKLEPFHKESISTKDGATEESSSHTLKLFGATLMLTDTCKSPSSPIIEVCKPIPAAMNLTRLHGRNFDATETPTTIVPWWRPFMALHKEPEGKHLDDSDHSEFESKEIQKEEGSWTGSNTSSVSDGDNNVEKTLNDQVKSHVNCYQIGNTTPSETSTISKLRVRPKTCGKGFVPYKRVMSNRESHCYSQVTSEKREEQWIRLSL